MVRERFHKQAEQVEAEQAAARARLFPGAASAANIGNNNATSGASGATGVAGNANANAGAVAASSPVEDRFLADLYRTLRHAGENCGNILFPHCLCDYFRGVGVSGDIFPPCFAKNNVMIFVCVSTLRVFVHTTFFDVCCLSRHRKHRSEEVQRCLADAARGAHDKTVVDATAKLLAPPPAAASSGASSSVGASSTVGAVGGEAPAVFEDDVARATAAAAVAKQTQKKLNGMCAAQYFFLKIYLFFSFWKVILIFSGLQILGISRRRRNSFLDISHISPLISPFTPFSSI